MQILRELLAGLDYECKQGSVDEKITKIIYDSRKIEEGCLFVCIRGANFDGHDAIGEAVEKKAAAVLVESTDNVKDENITVIRTPDTRKGLAFVAAAYFGHPAEKMKTIGITGTKGKTTTAYMVKSVLENAGYKVGLVGTIEVLTGSRRMKAQNTTPESYLLQEYFREMVENGCDAVVMEVSSQGLMMHRTAGFTFDYGIFTNLEPDHIGPNEHESFEDYMRCKGLLFQNCRHGILNGDDIHTKEVLRGHTCKVETFGLFPGNDLQATEVEMVKEGGLLGVSFAVKGVYQDKIRINIPGKFSVYNALTTLAVCRHFGVEEQKTRNALVCAKVKGRTEMVKVSDDFSLMIDYAHNAMALESLLSSLREYNPGRLVCLFGCGGNRSKMRRYEMGEISGKLADLTIITSDNPRFEDPMEIIKDIRVGMDKTCGEFVEIPDRKEAIRYAIREGKAGDIIVLAGKGHEDYQEIEGKKYPMDERVLIQEILAETK
ncbi:MAG: UDP-N-acetylmuramoyl-L-alanyl-D-glutamate--2,6-diaminopimelate ligase [Lachnospiraceae bacterium]|nr:UDP-N-acetylmuramoyl-L-alanyl-D-glutamate--2,6-diaminopimelate ligase [Lachnospiraceae bacterium]